MVNREKQVKNIQYSLICHYDSPLYLYLYFNIYNFIHPSCIYFILHYLGRIRMIIFGLRMEYSSCILSLIMRYRLIYTEIIDKTT